MNATMLPSTLASQRVNIVWSNVALFAVAAIGLLFHSYNMFGYPLFRGDEGIYMAQAYATVHLGQITPYAYWYDHAPAGWILIGVWAKLTGGFHTFGTAIDSGRVFMLLLHLASLALLFRVALRLTGSTPITTAACLLYTLSPLSIIFGRMVLLDNIMVFWALLAVVLLIEHDGKIWQLLYSGLCFGVAVLTKESAIFLMPAFVYGLWTLVERNQARFARAAWLFAALMTISLYFLYAALRKELIDLSFSSPLTGGSGPVTLFGAILWQVSRAGGAAWDPTSDFYRLLTTDWLVKDPWLLGLGALAALWNLARADQRRRLIALAALLSFLSIARGGVVHDFYITPLLPFLALNVALATADLAAQARKAAPVLALVAVAIVGYSNLATQQDVFTIKLTSIQRDALAWLQDHTPSQAQIVIDDDLWVDLRDGAAGKPSFPGAHSHWKVASDPAVYRDLYYNDWRNLDYIVISPGMEEIIQRDRDTLAYQAYSHSTPIARFAAGNAAVEIRRVDHAGAAVKAAVVDSYAAFKARFIRDGQVPGANGYTDARDQAAAMLMAVWMDDRATFDALWTWARSHLQSETGLLYQTNQPGGSFQSTTDADTDAALALLLAERRWNDASYGRHGKAIVGAIWNHAVVEIRGAPYLAAGDWAVSEDQIIFAPATFAPYAYHVFAQADPDHNWWHLLSNTYQLLADASGSPKGQRKVGLPPAYVGVNRVTGELLPNPAGLPGAFDQRAAEVFWRVGLDAQWHDDQRADAFLKASSFLGDEWDARGTLASGYERDGTPRPGEATLELYSALLPKFLVESPALAEQIYTTKLAAAFNRSQSRGHWGNGADIVQQRWSWHATALYAGALNYQWATQK